jgi:hypothetical protein
VLWLYYYEVWLVTAIWLGGGEHPGHPAIQTLNEDELSISPELRPDHSESLSLV